MFDFEKLEVYSRIKGLAPELLRFVFTNQAIDPFLRDQIKRAVISVQLNLAEGTGRLTSADKKHFYAMARSSVFECVALLHVLRSLQRISDLQYESWYREMEEISKMLLGLIRST